MNAPLFGDPALGSAIAPRLAVPVSVVQRSEWWVGIHRSPENEPVVCCHAGKSVMESSYVNVLPASHYMHRLIPASVLASWASAAGALVGVACTTPVAAEDVQEGAY